MIFLNFIMWSTFLHQVTNVGLAFGNPRPLFTQSKFISYHRSSSKSDDLNACWCNCITCSGPRLCCQTYCNDCDEKMKTVIVIPYPFPVPIPAQPTGFQSDDKDKNTGEQINEVKFLTDADFNKLKSERHSDKPDSKIQAFDGVVYFKIDSGEETVGPNAEVKLIDRNEYENILKSCQNEDVECSKLTVGNFIYIRQKTRVKPVEYYKFMNDANDQISEVKFLTDTDFNKLKSERHSDKPDSKIQEFDGVIYIKIDSGEESVGPDVKIKLIEHNEYEEILKSCQNEENMECSILKAGDFTYIRQKTPGKPVEYYKYMNDRNKQIKDSDKGNDEQKQDNHNDKQKKGDDNNKKNNSNDKKEKDTQESDSESEEETDTIGDVKFLTKADFKKLLSKHKSKRPNSKIQKFGDDIYFEIDSGEASVGKDVKPVSIDETKYNEIVNNCEEEKKNDCSAVVVSDVIFLRRKIPGKPAEFYKYRNIDAIFLTAVQIAKMAADREKFALLKPTTKIQDYNDTFIYFKIDSGEEEPGPDDKIQIVDKAAYDKILNECNKMGSAACQVKSYTPPPGRAYMRVQKPGMPVEYYKLMKLLK